MSGQIDKNVDIVRNVDNVRTDRQTSSIMPFWNMGMSRMSGQTDRH